MFDKSIYCFACEQWLSGPTQWVQCPNTPMEILGNISITAGSKCMAHAAIASISALQAVLEEGHNILNRHVLCTWCHLLCAKSCALLVCPRCQRKLKFIDSDWLKWSWRIQYRLLLDMFKRDTLILASTRGSPVKASRIILAPRHRPGVRIPLTPN